VTEFFNDRGEQLRTPSDLALALEQAGYEPLSAEAYSDALMDEWYRYVEQALSGLPGPDGAETASALKREIEVFRREGGRFCVNEVLFVARRKEPGERPPPSRGGE
jgi:hypothetical protein